ncbi:MAG: tetratricopeptide repeat protein [Vicingaceae bacterium]|nr:tetratricopeptide repeat protein [Vicingaceae bacterium]
MKPILLVITCLILIPHYGISQPHSKEELYYLDSLHSLIENQNSHDTVKVNGLFKLVRFYFLQQPDSAITVAIRAKNISEKIDYVDGKSNSYGWLGYLLKKQGDIPLALEYYHKGLAVAEKAGNKPSVSITLNNIGLIYKRQGDIENALKYYFRSLEIEEEINNKQGIAAALNNIAVIYKDQIDAFIKMQYSKEKINKKRNQALDFYRRSLEIYSDLDDQQGLAIVYNNIGSVYRNHVEDMLKNSENQDSIKVKTQKSLEYYYKSLDIEKSLNNLQGIAISQVNIGVVHLRQNNLLEAKKFGEKSMELSKKVGFPESIQKSAILLSNIYEKENKGIKALEMYRLYVEMRDSTNNKQTQKAAAQQQAKYEYEKKKVIDDAIRNKLIAIEKEKKEKQEIITYSTTLGLILVVVFLLFVFNRLKITRKQKQVIEHQNSEIVDSITYAKRIQEAILPTDDYINKYLPNSFILYKPKDIVAGDFYWVTNVNDKVYFAAADCTGHGVPGAMVSVVCHNALDRVLREFKLTKPADILNKTREIVEKQLNKSSAPSTSINNIRDGMDIALCCLNKTNNELQYAGAYNPLWILRKDAEEIEEIKATRQSIGRIETPKPFESHTVKLNHGDSIYIFSDGFADQFGGAKGKKLMYRKFKTLLIGMVDKDIKMQKDIINNYFENWKGDMEQIDDVCVIGVKI